MPGPPPRPVAPAPAVALAVALALTLGAGCRQASADASGDVAPLATVEPSPDDPLHGQYTLETSLRGLPPGREIVATIDTSEGTITCKLFGDRAPTTVANFVGLSRGGRPWKAPDGVWVKRPAYDNTAFHRILKGFMIQGGDPKKNGSGEAGYVIPDEVWPGAKHDHVGQLCMANRGPNTSSMQFFITDGAAPHLDKSFTIFGECAEVDVVHKIAAAAADGDKPKVQVAIRSVRVTRL